ncbi:ATP-binding cassette domain-containing protein [Paenibacillus whitsoniae]|uniref:ATP-binding cassette domain-containing protein n=1 Tax=Paenibacillus whitsoniae TaxID=2496558 RepID=A0A3S0CBY1_9BACL|nr:ATP-binding cassette domain-containing protein [Paenibacillus whitsoniae]RTE09460.1 ATP-binding cassette domain-containing protein [Paenibacillus whitsoniae]
MSLTLKRVSVTAPDNPALRLLNAVSVALHPNSLTLVIGHTGSGKSTLLQVMAGLLEPQEGEVLLDGESLWHQRKVAPQLLLRLGLTFQFPEAQLFARSIRQEFAYSLRPYKLAANEQERRIGDACAAFDPRGVFAPDRSPLALSGGEQRRLALATTFATEPDWLLMDEPTAGLEAAAVRELLRTLRARTRGGLVIATHDLDTFLPLADRVLVLASGELVFDGSPEALCRAPHVLVRAGVGLPSCAEAAVALARHGLAIAPEGLTPAATAQAIAAALRSRSSASPAAPPAEAPEAAAARAGGAAAAEPPQTAWLRRDPRAKWLLYLLLVLGTMQQGTWSGLAVAAGLLGCACLGLPRSALRGARKMAVAYLLFLAFSVALAGVRFTGSDGGALPIGYDTASGWSTALLLARLFVVLLAGMWLAVSTPFGQLVQGLTWALRYLDKVKLPVASFALAVSLLFRFIPLLLREWQQFAMIVRARGKAAVRPGTVRLRDLPALVVPLLLAAFHKAEQFTVAMELKRIDGKHLLRRRSTLVWRRKDTLLAVAAVAVYVVLWVVRA